MRYLAATALLTAAVLAAGPGQAAPVSRLEVQGSVGDGLTGGQSLVLEAGRFTTLVSARIVVDPSTFTLRSVPYGVSVLYAADATPGCLPLGCVARLDIAAASGGALGVGEYRATQLAAGASPGLNLTLGSAAFTAAAGSFSVADIAFAPGAPAMLPTLGRLDVRFTLQGVGQAGPVSGRLLLGEPVPVPEPGTAVLLLGGLAALAGSRWRR